MTVRQSRFSIQSILVIDAITCAAMAALLLLMPGLVAGLTQITPSVLFWAGLILVPVAIFMMVIARSLMPPAWTVQVVIAGNVLWVLASVILPLSGWIAPNALGWTFLLLQAAIVTVFAWLEWTAIQPMMATN